MKYFEIDADGNALILLKVDGENIEVLNAMDGYGDNIKDKTTIKEMETAKDKAIGLFCDFLKTNGEEPLFAECTIRFKEDGAECNYLIALTSDDSDDERVFYYCDSLNDLLSLTEEEGNVDFVITDIHGFLLHI